MNILNALLNGFIRVVEAIYHFLWGDIIHIPIGGGNYISLPILVFILIPLGIFCTIVTKFVPIRMFPEMVRVAKEKKIDPEKKSSVSGLEALIVSTATRVGMGNLVGVVAAVSAGGAGAIFWMWLTAIIGSSTAFVEATLAQKYKTEDPLYGLICWAGISQVIGNSVASAFENAFQLPTWITALIITISGAIIVLRKNISVKVLDVIVPIMAGFYLFLTIFVIINNITLLPSVLNRIFEEAFGARQIAAGGFGAVLMNGVKRGLFSNEAGSGSAPCAAAAADVDHPVKSGLLQSLGVFIDTLVICSCTAFVMLLAPADQMKNLQGMDLLQAAMQYHFGKAGVIFIAVTLFLFSFSTFIGVLYYARSNVAYIFGDNWTSQTIYKIIGLINLFVGCIAAYTFVWDMGDVGIGLMTIFNVIALIPMAKEATAALKDYQQNFMKQDKERQKELKKEA